MLKEEKTKTKDNIKPDSDSFINKVNNWTANFQKVSASEKIFFAQHLSLMVKAGLPLTKGLDALAKQTKNKRFQKIIYNISRDINQGDTLSEGLKKYPKIFNNLFINIIAAGEATGTLEKSLNYLYLQIKKDHQLNNKVRGALIYPAIIFIAMSAIGTVVMIYVIPKFISIFKDVKMELPIMTRLLIKFNDFVMANGIIIAIISFVSIVILVRFIKTPMGKKYFHILILKVPIISSIVKKINLARFSQTMSTLLKTDIKIVESFKIAASTVNNLVYRESLEEASERVKKGELINEILAKYPALYNNITLQMIAIGEETGELDSILDEIAQFYQEEVEEIMNTLPSIIEPIIILILASAIGAMAIAIVMPMYALTNAF